MEPSPNSPSIPTRALSEKMTLPVDSEVAPYTFRDAFKEDLYLWKDSNSLSSIHKVHESSWIFYGSTTLCICEPETINVIRAYAATLEALAVFDIVYTFWEVEVQNAKTCSGIQELALYHRALRHKILDALLRSKNPRQELDIVLQPWLMRTLCLYSHDLSSREKFNAVKRLSYLTEDGN